MLHLKRIQQKIRTKSTLFIQHKIMHYSFSEKRNILNRGVNGDNTFDLLQRLEKDVLNHEPKGVILMVGTNDALNAQKLVDVQQYKENLEDLTRKINLQKRFLLFITPPLVDDEIAILPHTSSHSCKQILQPYREAMLTVGKDLNVPCLDLYGIMQQHGELKTLLMNLDNSPRNDGVHPTAKGYVFMANAIHQKLKEVKAPLSKLVCFGDSITFGYLVKDEGQETGESYPAQLNAML